MKQMFLLTLFKLGSNEYFEYHCKSEKTHKELIKFLKETYPHLEFMLRVIEDETMDISQLESTFKIYEKANLEQLEKIARLKEINKKASDG